MASCQLPASYRSLDCQLDCQIENILAQNTQRSTRHGNFSLVPFARCVRVILVLDFFACVAEAADLCVCCLYIRPSVCPVSELYERRSKRACLSVCLSVGRYVCNCVLLDQGPKRWHACTTPYGYSHMCANVHVSWATQQHAALQVARNTCSVLHRLRTSDKQPVRCLSFRVIQATQPVLTPKCATGLLILVGWMARGGGEGRKKSSLPDCDVSGVLFTQSSLMADGISGQQKRMKGELWEMEHDGIGDPRYREGGGGFSGIPMERVGRAWECVVESQ